MDMTVTERIAALRRKMDNSGIDACLIVTDDFHGSEYVGAYFKTRAFFSGFTGSAGSLLVTAEEAYLWTDGRYFLQAEQQLRGSGIQLMRAGQPGVPVLSAFLAERMAAGGTLGFDGRTVSTQLYRRLEKALAGKNVRLEGGFDPAEGIWADRPGPVSYTHLRVHTPQPVHRPSSPHTAGTPAAVRMLPMLSVLLAAVLSVGM